MKNVLKLHPKPSGIFMRDKSCNAFTCPGFLQTCFKSTWEKKLSLHIHFPNSEKVAVLMLYENINILRSEYN